MNKKISLLEKLEKQKEELGARIQAVRARSKASERKKETRRKILVGSYYLDEARKNGQFKKLQETMNEYLKRDSDRVLFDLALNNSDE